MSELDLLAPFSGTLLDVVPVGVAISDYSGRVFAANRAMAALTGYTEQEQKERGADSMYALPEERERIVEEVLRSGSARGREARFQRKDCSFIVVCIDMVMVKSGGKTLLVTTAQDISQRKKAEDDLRKAERERALILDSAAEMIVYYDLDFRIRWANKATAVSVGMEPGELVGKRCYEIWHRRGEPCEHCPVLLARDTGLPREREDATPDGRYFFMRGYPVFDDRGRVSGMVEFSFDVTARKKVEESLRESSQFNQQIIACARKGVIVYDKELRYIVWNPYMEELSGLAADRVIGKKPLDIFPYLEETG